MSESYHLLREVGPTITIVAVPNGRVRYGVLAYRSDDTTTPICIADANLNDDAHRARVLEQLPEDARGEAAPMLLRLAAGVTEARLATRRVARTTTEDPFPDEQPWPDEVRGPTLMCELVALLNAYMVLPTHADIAIALWLVHTYLFDVADYTPYLIVTSPVRECGKSTLLELLLHLACRAQLTGGITAAALYRRIARHHPTMLLDELDTRLRGDSGELLRGVLNTGFHRSGKVTICVGDEQEDRDFSTFSPKVLAGIGRLWDTVASRAIPIRLARAPKHRLAQLERVRGDRIHDWCEPYRRQLVALAQQIRYAVAAADPVVPDQLGARQADVWRPLLAVADAIGGEWPQTARDAALALYGVAEEEGDYGLLMLEDVRQLFEIYGRDGKLPSATILEELGRREDRPWSEYGKSQKPITARGVASLLARFGVKPRNLRMIGNAGPVVKGYEFRDLHAAFETYLSPALPSATSATGAPETGESGHVADGADRTSGMSPLDRGEAWEPEDVAQPMKLSPPT